MAAIMEESLVSTKSWDRNDAGEETQSDDEDLKQSQSTPLLSQGKSFGLCSKIKYRKRGPVGTGALLLMASSFALHVFMPYSISAVLMKQIWGLNKRWPYATYVTIYKSFWIVFPISGLIADAKYGRYRVISCSTAVLLVASTIMLISLLLFVLVHNELGQIVSSIFLGIAVVLNYVGYAGYDANIIQFLTDQTAGASGEELSGLINMYFWVSACSELINLLCSEFITSNLSNSKTGALVILTIHFILCATTLYCLILLKKFLDATPKILNPVKLLYKVLTFAKINKYPRNRSALTLWEDTKLTRIDMAKTKYGGPFTEEEVEDVKTGLRLLPIIFLTAGIGLLINPEPCTNYFQQPTNNNAERKLIDGGIENALLTIVFVPVYLYVIYPIFYKYVPSLLKRVGLGLLLVIFSQVSLMVLDPILQNYASTNVCIFDNNASIPVDVKWCLPYTTISAVAELLVVLFGIEFIVAQSPQSMKGLAIGLWFSFYAIIQVVSINLEHLFKMMDHTKPSCGFYFFLTKSLISIVFLILYSYLAQHYTMRVRECPVNVHLIAEDHYTKYLPSGTVSSINEPHCDTESSTCSSCGSN